MIPLIITSLTIGSLESPAIETLPTSCHLSESIPTYTPTIDDKIRRIFHKASETTVYFGAGTLLGSASLLARLGWGISLISPWASTVGNECLLLSHMCDCAARRAFANIFKATPSSFRGAPLSQRSWLLNQKQLSQIPVSSKDDKQLLLFLEKRWLAKSSGLYSSLVDWVCPCFGISVQVHPETTGFYARNPWLKFPVAYQKGVEAWKQSLPHPQDFPLILTRPCNLHDYLPFYLDVPKDEKIEKTVERLAAKKQTAKANIVIDLTQIFADDANDRETWLRTWDAYRVPFAQACKELDIDPNKLLCIQREQREEIGGIRLLPLTAQPEEEIEKQHRFLLEWISTFGLSATRVELDRGFLPINDPFQACNNRSISIEFQSKDEFISYFDSFDQNWKSSHPQKILMHKGTLQVLKGLFASLSDDKWSEILHSPTRVSIVQLSFLKIREQLSLLAQEDPEASFFDFAGRIEQIHANLSTLLEVFSPFSSDAFPRIYRECILSIPSNLKPLASYGIHSSGMTSLAGIFKATERTLGRPPHVLYGENAYFENINASNMVSHAVSIPEATESDWAEVDLILAQFNPVLKRINFRVTEYKVEKIEEVLRRSFSARQGKPLTLAIDCTFDFIDSPRVARLLDEFQEEIELGILNVICYRSGLKFDLFGMDNYCGAPFSMVHSQDAKWGCFDALLTDPVLQPDRLSLNWFCLAYQTAAPQLELYRKQVFDNTRDLLNKVPSRLLNKDNTNYRIIPMEQGADLAFIDIKVSGFFHEIRTALLIGGFLTVECMENGHPIFYRPSVGFYHPNFTILFSKECSTVRLTLGLDPAQVDLLARCFERIDALNGLTAKQAPESAHEPKFMDTPTQAFPATAK